MSERVCADGSIVFETEIDLAPSEMGKQFSWNVLTDGPLGLDRQGVTTEVNGARHDALHRSFELTPQTGEQRYYLTHVRRLGAQKVRLSDSEGFGLRFAVWAPNAQAVEVVFGDPRSGYIANDGSGIDASRPVITLEKGEDGVWLAGPWNTPALRRFSDFVGAPYMYRIKNEQGELTYRTDLHSRAQIGTGDQNPDGKPFAGDPSQLNGVVSCSLVVDTEKVQVSLDSNDSREISDEEFWRDEFDHATPFPYRIDDMVIYELHVGSLGFGQERPGNFEDAIALLDYLSELGVNAVELLPIAEAHGFSTWGYGNSHHFAIESSAGGRDKFRHFVRACHQRGIASSSTWFTTITCRTANERSGTTTRSRTSTTSTIGTRASRVTTKNPTVAT